MAPGLDEFDVLLEVVLSLVRVLGVIITSDLRWNIHVSNVCTKANRTLGFLRRSLYSYPQEVKEAGYKGLVLPVLDYGCQICDR